MIVIILLAIIAVVAVVLIISKSGKNKETDETKSDNKIELEKSTSSTIHFSNDFKSDEPIIKKENDHVISTILRCKEDSFIWVCPTCETENPPSKHTCCVCNGTK